MSTDIKQLIPASKSDVIIYMPYYGKDKHRTLPLAISLYQQGLLEGERQIEGGENLSFVATWGVSSLPSELTRCSLQFERDAEYRYEMTIENSEFIDHLIDIILNYDRTRLVDFPRTFYKKLLNFVDEKV
ncbi:type IV pilus biogenesis protein EbsA [Gloeocapsa sp. PCC 73106]|uniref:type IV pilus biogenesis protein EbsA n=1 Tax=Gloeocapsa sp. PCC 73106 TaxID=102232 RepID=UPI0002ACF24E|nr:type IV pilus biogenesis protein EbsA [Gloeocapsa sp. PCC 73106]ELR98288.1 hypothetical protein GLO73106DRAFT_00021160 [Gloeocapsa sp. PCC 73106]